MAKAKGGLGKGLGALLPVFDEEEILKENADEVKKIALAEIIPNPEQPRKVFDEDEMQDLAASVKEHGVLVPIIVNKNENDTQYVIVAGERRYRASRLAEKTDVSVYLGFIPSAAEVRRKERDSRKYRRSSKITASRKCWRSRLSKMCSAVI